MRPPSSSATALKTLSASAPDRAHQNCRTFSTGRGKPLQFHERCVLERRLQDQVFGRVAVEEEFGEDDDVGAGRARLHVSVRCSLRVAAKIAEDGIELR